MAKVYLIGSGDADDFQDAVNRFIKDKKVIDIKYQAFLVDHYVADRALIIYEEVEDDEQTGC